MCIALHMWFMCFTVELWTQVVITGETGSLLHIVFDRIINVAEWFLGGRLGEKSPANKAAATPNCKTQKRK